MRYLGLLLCVFSLGCSAFPALRGSRFATAHYDIHTDTPNPEFAFRVARLAEHFHHQLASYYGRGDTERIPLFIFTDRATFDEHKWTERSYGEFISHPLHGSFSLVYWSTQTLAHELVHHFVESFDPDLPLWKNEGIAQALDHRAVQPPVSYGSLLDDGQLIIAHHSPCPVDFARSLRDEEILALAEALPALEIDGDRYREKSQLGAAIVRFGLETQGWADLTALSAWEPDLRAFLVWLRSVDSGEESHRAFPPLLETLEHAQRRLRD